MALSVGNRYLDARFDLLRDYTKTTSPGCRKNQEPSRLQSTTVTQHSARRPSKEQLHPYQYLCLYPVSNFEAEHHHSTESIIQSSPSTSVSVSVSLSSIHVSSGAQSLHCIQYPISSIKYLNLHLYLHLYLYEYLHMYPSVSTLAAEHTPCTELV